MKFKIILRHPLSDRYNGILQRMNDILDKKNWRKSHILTHLHHLRRPYRDLLPRSTQFRNASSSLSLPSISFLSFITRGSGVFTVLSSSLPCFFGFRLDSSTHVPFCSHYSQISVVNERGFGNFPS